MATEPLVYLQLSIMPTKVAIILAFYPCCPPTACLIHFAWTCLCCVSARFAPDACNQRLWRRPLPTLRPPAQHSRGGRHWTDVRWPAQLLVAGACHLTRPCFISTSVTWWKKKSSMPSLAGLGPGEHAMSLRWTLSSLWLDAACHRSGVTSWLNPLLASGKRKREKKGPELKILHWTPVQFFVWQLWSRVARHVSFSSKKLHCRHFSKE